MKSGAAAMNSDLAAALDPHDPLADGIRHPDRPFRVQRPAVRTDGRRRDQHRQVVAVRQRAEVRPVPPGPQRPIGLDVEFRDAVAEGLVDDKRLAVRGDE
ncbi:hypothetical protein G6F23_015466 [Rhizopus arrhizus]|nr:hypothetical protein G6F23_015466 [Rhizopus arrhizus]